MRFIYSFIWVLIIPFIVLRLWWKSLRLPIYRQRIKERFTGNVARITSVDIWLHAVSLGEVTAAIPLIEKLLEHHLKLMVTTTTPTGSKKLTDTFGTRVQHQFLPYDLLLLQRRFLKYLQPKKVIVMETELWPNMVHAVNRSNTPLLLINARLSEQSFAGYDKIRNFIAPVLQSFSYILTQTQEDAERFLALGAVQSHTKVLGNLKFDAALNDESKIEAIKQARKHLDCNAFIWLAASTHANEEEILIQSFLALKKTIPTLLLMIAPRHPERFSEVLKIAQGSGLEVGTRSQCRRWNRNTALVILDSLGELSSFYTISDLCFIGGSLVSVGGHNMLEAAQGGAPILCGQHYHNFSAIVEELKRMNAISIVASPQQLEAELKALYNDSARRHAMINNAHAVIKRNQGALKKYLHYCLR